MDIYELRFLAAGGLLVVGIVASLLGLVASAAIDRIGRAARASRARAERGALQVRA